MQYPEMRIIAGRGLRSETFSLGKCNRTRLLTRDGICREFGKIHARPQLGCPRFAGEFIFSGASARSRSVNTALQINIAPWNSGAICTQRSPSGETKYFSMSEHLIETSWYSSRCLQNMRFEPLLLLWKMSSFRKKIFILCRLCTLRKLIERKKLISYRNY